MAWYRTGTVAVTVNSKNVTGAGTGWSSISGSAIVGSAFRGPDGRVYEVASLNNDASITLVENYLGPTASGQPYALMPTLGLAADLAKGVGDLMSSAGAKVSRAGDTMTGNLNIQPNTNAILTLIKPGSGMSSGIVGYAGTLPRWGMDFGGASPETGGNIGSDFGIYRYGDDGAYIATAVHIARATGRVTINGPVECASQIYSGDAMVALNGFQWTNPRAWGLTAMGYFDEGPFRRASIFQANSLGGRLEAIGYHRVGVEAMLRINVFGADFDLSNAGVGRSTGGWIATSDRRAKDDIQPITGALDKLATMGGYTYLRPDMVGLDGVVPRRAGLIAQEVDDVLPEAVVHGATSADLLALDYNGCIGLLVAAVNELRAEVRELRGRA